MQLVRFVRFTGLKTLSLIFILAFPACGAFEEIANNFSDSIQSKGSAKSNESIDSKKESTDPQIERKICKTEDLQLFRDPEQPIVVKSGDEFEISLPAGGFAGLSPELLNGHDATIVEFISRRFTRVDCCDQFNESVFLFRAVGSGKTDISFDSDFDGKVLFTVKVEPGCDDSLSFLADYSCSDLSNLRTDRIEKIFKSFENSCSTDADCAVTQPELTFKDFTCYSSCGVAISAKHKPALENMFYFDSGLIKLCKTLNANECPIAMPGCLPSEAICVAGTCQLQALEAVE